MDNIKDIQYLGIDLDGTLLDSNKVIKESTIKKIQELKDNGKFVVLVSGRHYWEMIPYIKQMKLSEEDYAISCDGGYIYSCDDSLLWRCQPLGLSDIKRVRSLVPHENLLLVTDKTNYQIVPNFIPFFKSYILYFVGRSSKVFYGTPHPKAGIKDIEKIVCYNRKRIDAIKELSDSYTVHDLEEGRIEILSYGINKYSTLCVLHEIKGVDLNKMIYFGNDYNDLECFENLKHCVAMGDSPIELKEKAIYVTNTCDDEGVLKAIEKLGL